MMAKGYDETDEAKCLVEAIRNSGRDPSDALVLLTTAIATVFRNTEGMGLSDEEFAKSIGDTVLDAIRADRLLRTQGMRRQ